MERNTKRGVLKQAKKQLREKLEKEENVAEKYNNTAISN